MSTNNPYSGPANTGATSNVLGVRTVVIKHIDLASAGMVLGAMYGLIGVIIGGFFALFGLLGVALGGGEAAAGGIATGFFGLILMPIFYGVAGFIGGIITALIYNLIAGITGGLKIDMEG